MRARRNRAFTLVEILIVVVILGILAAVVIPQFVNASDEAQVGNVETQLRTLRTQIQLFRAQSAGNVYPDLTDGGGADADWAAMVAAQLLQSAPINPRTNSGVVVGSAATGGAGITAAQADTANGWFYNQTTGEIWACAFNEDYRQDGTNNPW